MACEVTEKLSTTPNLFFITIEEKWLSKNFVNIWKVEGLKLSLQSMPQIKKIIFMEKM